VSSEDYFSKGESYRFSCFLYVDDTAVCCLLLVSLHCSVQRDMLKVLLNNEKQLLMSYLSFMSNAVFDHI